LTPNYAIPDGKIRNTLLTVQVHGTLREELSSLSALSERIKRVRRWDVSRRRRCQTWWHALLSTASYLLLLLNLVGHQSEMELEKKLKENDKQFIYLFELAESKKLTGKTLLVE